MPGRVVRFRTDALFSARPVVAFLTEQAGGMATTGTERLLDVQPTDIHQRVPCFLGSKEDVQDLLTFFEPSK